jgi:hypothetical protein
MINSIQPSVTLLPFISTKEFIGLAIDTMRPSLRKEMMTKGVFESTGKLEATHDMVQHSTSKLYKPWTWFQRTVENNRMMGYLHGYRKALREGKSAEAAHWEGDAWAEKVEFDNSKQNVPLILNSPQGRVFGQFKSFQLKNAENVREVFTGKVKNKAERVGRVGKWAGAQVAVGGVKSLGAGVTVVGGYKIAQYFSQQLQSLGMKQDDADKWADGLYFGAPALFDMDLSANVGIFELPYGYSDSDKLINLVGGPTVSDAIKLKRGIQSKSLRNAGKAVVGSYWVNTGETIADIAKSGIDGVTVKTGGNSFERLKPNEAMARLAGVQPLTLSKIYARREAGQSTAKPKAVAPTFGDTTKTQTFGKTETFGGAQ